MSLDHHFEEPTAIRTNLGAIFVSLELSRSTWLITSLSPGGGEKMSKHGVSGGNIAALLMRLSELKQKAFARTGKSFHVIAIQEAGLDGFWLHRLLQSEGVESHVVDPAPIATSRRRGAPLPDNATLAADLREFADILRSSKSMGFAYRPIGAPPMSWLVYAACQRDPENVGPRGSRRCPEDHLLLQIDRRLRVRFRPSDRRSSRAPGVRSSAAAHAA